MKKILPFRFKKFAVSHHRSAMKVGVDGVLAGCWTEVGNAGRVLDVGAGCGLIALIMAQRLENAKVVGIDVDSDSVIEARENVVNSPWKDRVEIVEGSFPEALQSAFGNDNCRFDLIVSNPPYFDSGISEISTSRERARHQGILSPLSILEASREMLNKSGTVAMVLPADLSAVIENKARDLGYVLIRKCLVRGHQEAPYKRALLQWKRMENEESDFLPKLEYLTLETSSGQPTDEYRDLCKDFYLKF